MRDFGIYKRLRDIREDLDLTQADVASYLDVSKSTYSKWENEVEVMPLRRVVMFSNMTKKSLDYITGLSDISEDIDFINSIDIEQIGNRLKESRIKSGYTQSDLANILGTSQSCISEYESGKKLILSSYVVEICKLYDISFNWLING